MKNRAFVVGLAAALAALAAAEGRAEEARSSAEPHTAAAPPSASPQSPSIPLAELTDVAAPGADAMLRYGNRPIVLFRARILGRSPRERATATVRRLDDLADEGLQGPVDMRLVGGVSVLTVGGRDAVTILPTDIDALAGETLAGVSVAAADNLRRAMAEVVEARSPALLLRGSLRALVATALALLLGSLLWWTRDHVSRRLTTWFDNLMARGGHEGTAVALWRTARARLLRVAGALSRVAFAGLGFALAYSWLTFVLRQFPYTRPWGEALRGFLTATVERLGTDLLAAIPGLFTVVLILFATRLAARASVVIFQAAEEGRLRLPGVYPETALPTRRLVVALLWLFAVVVAFPYLPGSDSDAFKGVSVFVGLMLSLGSTGLVNQAMSSFMITYSRALRTGDYVRIGDVEGTVVHAGMLATKIRNRRNEEVTLPNAVVSSSTIVNYSRHPEEGVFAPTSVTIGYDTPWRQVTAMMIEAAGRTSGVRKEPPPRVTMTGLQDFYVEYTLAVVVERPNERPFVLSELHAHILDVFNEHGVQIMSPHYVSDPEGAKVVPKGRWFEPPADPGTGA